MRIRKVVILFLLTSSLMCFFTFGHGGEDHGAPKQLQAPHLGSLVKSKTGSLYLELVKKEDDSMLTLFPYVLDNHKKLKVVNSGDIKVKAKGISKRKGNKIFLFKIIDKKHMAELEFEGVNVFQLQVIIKYHGKNTNFVFTVELEDEE